MGSLSLPHWIILFLVIMLLFGSQRLPSLGKNIGEAIRSLKQGLGGIEDEPQKLPPSPEPKADEPPKKA